MVKKTKVLQTSTSPVHRGRFQAQGPKLESSEAWARPIPPSTEEGEAMLLKLESKLERPDATIRQIAFNEARNFIQRAHAAGGVNAEMKKTFMVRNTCSDRVDVEIRSGLAFKLARNV